MMNSVYNKRFTKGAIESSAVVSRLRDSTENDSTERHLVNEVIILFVRELVKTSTHRHVMGDLDEAASFADVGDVASAERPGFHGETSTVLQNLIANVAAFLPLLVSQEELARGALWLDESPHGLF